MKKYYIFRMNTRILNVLSVVLFGVIILLTLLINKDLLINSLWIKDFPVFAFEMIIFTISHEVLHAASYVVMGAKFKNIYFGAALEKGILYCLCKENISKKNILMSLLSPLVIIGIITYVISFIFNYPRLLLLSMINISGCTGDLLMFNFIRKLKDIQFSEFDSEDEFAIYSKEDIKGSFGLDYVKKTDKLKINETHKIKISTVSVISLLILLLMAFMVR